MGLTEGISVPGDYVDLRAEIGVLTVISGCPRTNNTAMASTQSISASLSGSRLVPRSQPKR